MNSNDHMVTQYAFNKSYELITSDRNKYTKEGISNRAGEMMMDQKLVQNI